MPRALPHRVLQYVIGQLDTSVAFWHALAQAIDSETPPARPKDRELADRLWDLARVAGYKVSVQADAWQMLHKVPPEDQAKDFLTVFIAQHNRTPPPGWDGVIELDRKS